MADEAVPACISETVASVDRLAPKITVLDSHVALFLPKNCLAVPKLLYVLKTSLAWQSAAHLQQFDGIVRKADTSICNVPMADSVLVTQTV